jgi:hypothetical protein
MQYITVNHSSFRCNALPYIHTIAAASPHYRRQVSRTSLTLAQRRQPQSSHTWCLRRSSTRRTGQQQLQHTQLLHRLLLLLLLLLHTTTTTSSSTTSSSCSSSADCSSSSRQHGSSSTASAAVGLCLGLSSYLQVHVLFCTMLSYEHCLLYE